MKATGVNLKKICELEESDSACVDVILASTDFEDLIEQAKNGDKYAARELLALASGYLTSEVFGAMPLELKRYLGRALAMASIKGSADVALNLRRSGRPRQEHRTKLRLGHWIYKQMNAGKKLEEASFELEGHIKAGIETHGKFYGYTQGPDSKTLEGIYNEVLPEIRSTYRMLPPKPTLP
jgi:hypothetical protein